MCVLCVLCMCYYIINYRRTLKKNRKQFKNTDYLSLN
jgi:hypothetical protein